MNTLAKRDVRRYAAGNRSPEPGGDARPIISPGVLQARLRSRRALWFGYDRTPARLAMAEAAVQEAFRIRPNAGEAHYARAVHLYRGYRDFDGALAELELARQTLPNHAPDICDDGLIQRRQGRWEESTRNLERSVELDPRNIETLQQIAFNYRLLDRYAEAKSWLARALAVRPEHSERDSRS